MADLPRVEICFSPELLHLHAEEHDIVVVIDVLRATSAICSAFYNGVVKMYPVSTIEEAKEFQAKGLLAGAERNGEVVEGFELGNSPFHYMTDYIKGKEVALSTTNGTKCINLAKSVGKQVVIGSISNLNLLSDWLIEEKRNTLLFCSGWKGKFNLEDTVCAGAIADQLLASGEFRSEHDSTIAGKYLFYSARDNMFGYLRASSHRRRLKRLNLNEDIIHCLTPNTAPVIPVLDGDALVKLK